VGTGATYYWTFGDGATSTDMNPNHSYAAPGTYNVVLTVTDFVPCTAASSTSLDVISITTRTDFHDTIVCLRLPLQIESYTDVIPSSLTNITYQWMPGTNLSDPTIPNPTFTGVGDYTYTLTATVLPIGCTASDVMTIHSKPPIILTHVTVDQVIPIGGSIQLNADSAWIYVWTPNDGSLSNPNINNPIATPIDSVTTYMVVGMSPYGCRDSAYVTIRVDPTVTEFIPEAFTPNGDGLNDVFRVFNLGYYQKLVDFRIYNRWGHEVYHSINPKQGWDGTLNGVPQDMGTYYYQVIVANPDGKQKSLNGSVTLIR
jgi:gliding motility-associated-like protein